jgi:hypothetical protein
MTSLVFNTVVSVEHRDFHRRSVKNSIFSTYSQAVYVNMAAATRLKRSWMTTINRYNLLALLYYYMKKPNNESLAHVSLATKVRKDNQIKQIINHNR